jgi:putative chitobiose transport system substrate-binding protein
MNKKGLSLAVFLILTIASMVLSSCAAPTTPPTPEVIKETVVVPETVKETVEVPVTQVVPATPAPTQTEKIVIQWWTIVLKDAFGDYLQGLIDTYEAEHPNVTIEWTDVGADVQEKLMAAVTAGTAPDVVDMHIAFGFATMAQLGVFANLDELTTAEQRAAFSPTIWKNGPGTLGSVTYGIPWYGGSWLLYYNKSILQEAGLDPEKPPTTYEELLSFATQIKEQTGKSGLSFFVNAYYLAPFFYEDGVPLVSEDGKTAVINTPQAITILDRLAKAYQDGAIPQEAITVGGQAGYVRDDVDWFNGELTGMLLSDPWLTRTLPDNLLPNLGMANGPLGQINTYTSDGHFYVILKQSKHQAEALDWALFVTNAQNQLDFCKLVAITPSTLETLQDPLFSESPAQLVTKDDFDQEGRYLVAQQLPQASAPPNVPGWDEMMEVFRVQVDAVLLGEKTSQQALADTELEWNKILSRP